MHKSTLTNKNRKWRGPYLWVLLFFFILAIFPQRFVAINLPTETIYLKHKQFDIQWVHSVEKESWIESYEVRGSSFLLTTTSFKTFGAGVPSDGQIEIRDDGFVHMTINREMDDILLVVSDLVKTTVRSQEKEIALYDLVQDYEEVQITVNWLPWWTILK